MAVFVLLGSCTVADPVVGYLVASRRMQAPLDDLRVWLYAANNATVMAVLLLVIGASSTSGKGLGGL